MLYSIFIAPIEVIVEWVFSLILNKFSFVGVIGAVFGVSIVINFLALPLYNVADALQEKERNISKQLEYRVKRIKKAFKGDEQFMMLSTYYRENNYSPIFVLRSSLSILIEIPFFIAAYHYLSNCEALQSASFWVFKDLGAPDSLFRMTIANKTVTINVLPVLMTVINFVSGYIYTKKAPLREKVQLYCVALLFLVLLYNSPSGLVIYWILNNVFSLVKNIVQKAMPQRQKKSREIAFLDKMDSKQTATVFILSALCITVFSGLLLPSSVIASSPVEFSYLGSTENPLSYIFYSLAFFTGMFFLWPFAIYKMFDGKNFRRGMALFFFALIVFVAMNVFALNFDYGDISPAFEVEYEWALNNYPLTYEFIPLLVIILAIGLFLLFYKFKWMKVLSMLLVSFCVGETAFGIFNCIKINKDFSAYRTNIEMNRNNSDASSSALQPVYSLSRTEKNVMVIFLDRAIGAFVPDIFSEFEDIESAFSDFTYYENTVSFSTNTVTGYPAMMGGYEYNQENINSRSNVKLREKHNESLLVMPRLFSEAGFSVTVTDPAWPNYSYKGDLSCYEDYPEFNVSEIEGNYLDRYLTSKNITSASNDDLVCRKEIRNFTVMEILPPGLRSLFYFNCKKSVTQKNGSYMSFNTRYFLNSFSNLYYLPEITELDSENGTFTFMENLIAHDVFVSLEDDYETIAERDGTWEEKHYQANIAAYKLLARYFEYLKQNDVYDNTRIILVSDHGRRLNFPQFSNFNDSTVPSEFNALLMVKDFNQKEGGTDSTFMTNADTLFLAKEGLPVSDVNPFTNKKFQQEKEGGVTIWKCIEWNALNLMNDEKFELDKKQAFHVQGDIRNPDNWIPLEEYEK